MIKNSLLLLAGLGAACGQPARAEESKNYQGVVEYDERLVAFEVGGRVARLEVVRGGTVAGGAVVAVLDSSLVRLEQDARAAELRGAEAQLALIRAGARGEEVRSTAAQLEAARTAESLAQRNVARATDLAARGAGATAVLDDAQGRLEQATATRTSLENQMRLLRGGARAEEIRMAEAKVEAARAAVALLGARGDRHTVLAPIAGTVLETHVAPGEVVAPGAPVASLADVAAPYVDVFVPEGEVLAVREGAAVRVRADGLEGDARGRVETVGRRTEFTPRYLFSDRERPNLVVRVRVRLEPRDAPLHAGIPVFVTIEGT